MIEAAAKAIGPILKAAALVAALAALVYLIANGIKSVYAAGDAAGAARVQKILDQAVEHARAERAEHAEKVAYLRGLLATQEADAARKLAAAIARAEQVKIQVKEAVNANPSFAAVERPADLRRVRDGDFAELEQAAAAGAHLSSIGLPGVPGASAGDRLDDGDGGDRGPGEPASLALVHSLP